MNWKYPIETNIYKMDVSGSRVIIWDVVSMRGIKGPPPKKMDYGPDKKTLLNYDQFCGPFGTLTLTQKSNIICCQGKLRYSILEMFMQDGSNPFFDQLTHLFCDFTIDMSMWIWQQDHHSILHLTFFGRVEILFTPETMFPWFVSFTNCLTESWPKQFGYTKALYKMMVHYPCPLPEFFRQ